MNLWLIPSDLIAHMLKRVESGESADLVYLDLVNKVEQLKEQPPLATWTDAPSTK